MIFGDQLPSPKHWLGTNYMAKGGICLGGEITRAQQAYKHKQKNMTQTHKHTQHTHTQTELKHTGTDRKTRKKTKHEQDRQKKILGLT